MKDVVIKAGDTLCAIEKSEHYHADGLELIWVHRPYHPSQAADMLHGLLMVGVYDDAWHEISFLYDLIMTMMDDEGDERE